MSISQRILTAIHRIIIIGLLALLLAAPVAATSRLPQEITATAPAGSPTTDLDATPSPAASETAPAPSSPEPSTPAPPVETPTPDPGAITPTGIPAPATTTAPTLAPTLEPTQILTPTPPQLENPITTTVTVTPTTTITPTIAPAAFSPLTFMPQVFQAPPFSPAEGVLFCAPLNSTISIPDNQLAGVDSTMEITDDRLIADLDIRLTIDHTWVGDLAATLRNDQFGVSASLFDRPGYPSTQNGCEYDNVRAVFNDEMDSSAERICAPSPAGIPGSYEPVTPLEVFDRLPIQGAWTLNVSDNYKNDTGKITSWCLFARLSPNPEPTPEPPPPPSLPSRVILSGITGKPQLLPLDCESRSAVDWANYFGVKIDEQKFFNSLPGSDNPDKGFVGDVMGTWGQIPPDDYGVHAEPIAALLRDYGLPAYARRPLGWDWLRAEIAAGRPVIVWITGDVEYGIPVFYTPASDGLTTLVARYEHTVVVTGYSDTSVYYLNGAYIRTRSINQFLASWSAMGYMAVAATP